MVQNGDGSEGGYELLTEISSLYYFDHATQEELSQRFGISRAKVGRLLRRARSEGIVEIRVHAPPNLVGTLEAEFQQRFGLERLLLSVDHRDQDVQRSSVANLVANYLSRTLTDDMVVAVGMGRNVAAAANFNAPVLRSVTFVAAIGGSIRAGEHMNSDHIGRRLAQRFGGESETLYAPAFVADPAAKAMIIRNETVKRTLDKARRADVALIGIGDLSEDSNMVRMGWFSPHEVAEARLSGTVGDLMGYDFIDIEGKPSGTAMQGRVIGINTADLRRIPDVIAVASENTKVSAILGALRTGVINTLATCVANAHTIMNLDEATRKRPNSDAQAVNG